MRVQNLTAETLLSLPRRSIALPNPTGTSLIYRVSTHSFAKSTAFDEIRVMDVRTGGTKQIVADPAVHDAQWLPGPLNLIVYLRDDDQGGTEVKIANTGDLPWAHRVVARLDGRVGNLKVRIQGDGTFVLAMTGLVGDDGELWNGQREQVSSTARVFDTPNVKVWDGFFNARRHGLWYTAMTYDRGWFGVKQPLVNLLKDMAHLEPAGIYDVDDAKNYFDIGEHGIAFIARDVTSRDPRKKLDTQPYYCHIDDFTAPPPSKPRLLQLPRSTSTGTQTTIRVAPESRHVGFLHHSSSDVINQKLYIAALPNYEAHEAFIGDTNPDIYEPPTGFDFAGAHDEVIMTTQLHGRTALAHMRLREGESPRVFTFGNSVTGYFPYLEGRWDRLLVTSSSLVESSVYQIVDVKEGKVLKTISSVTQKGKKLGLSGDMASDLWFEGADGICVHALVVKPSNFDEKKKYPWVLMPHGGPVSAWSNEWSYRWNPAAWAEQGYIVVLPNLSGSTGYGLAFARRINDSWGGKPYEDLVNLVNCLKSFPYLDQDRAVLAGASYGAYLISWIFGHDLARVFCCAIWHDGVFAIPTLMLQTDFPDDDSAFAGPPYIWQNSKNLEKFNPARPDLLKNWARNAPPTLVVHSEKDYRCPVTEGLAMFESLQAQGVPSRFLTFPDEGHWVLKPKNSLEWHKTVWDWMRRCCKGEVKRGDATW